MTHLEAVRLLTFLYKRATRKTNNNQGMPTDGFSSYAAVRLIQIGHKITHN